MNKNKLFVLFFAVFSFLFLHSGCSDSVSPDNYEVHSVNFPANTVLEDSSSIEMKYGSIKSVVKVDILINGEKVSTIDKPELFSRLPVYLNGYAPGSELSVQFSATNKSNRVIVSDPVKCYYLWRPLASDADEGFPKNIKSVFVRSTASRLEFRVESYSSWGNPHSVTEGFSTGIFIDTDNNKNTGMMYNPLIPGTEMNDIGPELCAVTGFEGNAVYRWSDSLQYWYSVAEYKTYSLLPATKVVEVSIDRNTLPNTASVSLVVKQLTELNGVQMIDKVPDTGHISYTIDGLSRVQMNGPSVNKRLNPGREFYLFPRKSNQIQ